MDTADGLQKYFELDIIEFLDKKLNKSQQTLKEYLEKNDVIAAIELFKLRIKLYNDTKVEDTYKQVRYNEILEDYEQIKKYLEKHPHEKLQRIIELIDSETATSSKNPLQLNVFNKLENEKQEIEFEKEQKDLTLKNKLDSDIKKTIENMFISIRKQDLRKSIGNYRDLKMLFLRYPSRYDDDKKEIYKDLISFFMQIKKLKTQLKEQIKNDSRKVGKTKDMDIHEQIKLHEIKELIDQIKEKTRQLDFATANNILIDLRHITNKIPDKYKHIRLALESRINVIGQRIDFIKRMSTDKHYNMESNPKETPQIS